MSAVYALQITPIVYTCYSFLFFSLQECDELRKELRQKSKINEGLSKKLESLNAGGYLALKTRLKKTREQLCGQMKKTKDMVILRFSDLFLCIVLLCSLIIQTN